MYNKKSLAQWSSDQKATPTANKKRYLGPSYTEWAYQPSLPFDILRQ